MTRLIGLTLLGIAYAAVVAVAILSLLWPEHLR